MRDVTMLHPILQCKIKELQAECKKQGLKIGIGECARTVAEQNALYAKGRTTAGSIVTNANGAAFQSMHQWFVAFDFYRDDGKGAYYNNDGFFKKVADIAVGLGSLESGGYWKSITDWPHIQLKMWGSTTSKLKNTYGTPEKFKNTWWTVGNTYTLAANSSLHSDADMSAKTKVKYNAITSDSMKKACVENDGGYAIMQAGKKFLLKEIKICSGYVMGKTKSGYWVPLFYNNKIRV